MPTWLLIIVIAQFFYAVAAIVDKFIITSKKVSKPFIYAFYVTILSALPIFLFFFGSLGLEIGGFQFPSIENVSRPSLSLISMALVAAFAGFNGLVSMYSALREADASDVVPVVGSVSAVGALLLSYLVLDDTLTGNFMIALGFLVLGTALISRLRFNKKVLLFTLHAGFLFALKATVIKKMFVDTSFDQAFFWTRIGLVIFIISLLLVPRYLGKIKHNTKKTKASGGLWVLGNAVIGGIAAFLTLKAIDLGNVTIIQALGGLQFIILILISFFFGKMIPEKSG
jgi:drug/metabolite transporter (DMT)-like permease